MIRASRAGDRLAGLRPSDAAMSAVVGAALAGRGDRVVVVLGDPAYYRRFGFEPGAAYGVTGAWSSFGEAWQVLPPAGGVPAGEVLYPAAWHEL